MGLFQPALTIILVFVFFSNATGQMNFNALGARARGMGDASVALEDSFSPFNNIGGTAAIEEITAVAAYENRFNFKHFQHFGAGFMLPLAPGVISLTAQKIGAEYYNEQNYGIGFSNKLGFVSLGIQLNYTQYHIAETGTKGVPSLAFGGVAKLLPSLSFGAHIYNLNQAKISKEENLYLPVILKSGLSYEPAQSLIIGVEIEKDIDKEARIKGGLEYQVIKKFSLRTGISSFPYQHHFGLGFSPTLFSIDYALTTHANLGLIHQMSLVYKFRRPSSKKSLVKEKTTD